MISVFPATTSTTIAADASTAAAWSPIAAAARTTNVWCSEARVARERGSAGAAPQALGLRPLGQQVPLGPPLVMSHQTLKTTHHPAS
jgi:hypothetical protein